MINDRPSKRRVRIHITISRCPSHHTNGHHHQQHSSTESGAFFYLFLSCCCGDECLMQLRSNEMQIKSPLMSNWVFLRENYRLFNLTDWLTLTGGLAYCCPVHTQFSSFTSNRPLLKKETTWWWMRTGKDEQIKYYNYYACTEFLVWSGQVGSSSSVGWHCHCH